MKKVRILLIGLLCLSITGCSNEFAQKEYDSSEKIAQTEDRYVKQVSVFNQKDGEYIFTVSKFDGRETLWSDKVYENQDIEIGFSFKLSKGQAKVVHIDDEGNVTTVIECSPDTSTDGYVTEKVALKCGQNRLKIVGYDCEDVELKMLFTELK